MSALTYKLSNAELERALSILRVPDETKLIAKALLVDNMRVKDAIANFNKSRTRIYQIRDMVWAAHLRVEHIPSDWRQFTTFAPDWLIDEFLVKLNKEKQRLIKNS